LGCDPVSPISAFALSFALGVLWWVDDFGTGFSSISHLRDLPIAGLKFDMSFTRELSSVDNHATNLARGLAGLATGIGLATVAEGVETAEQAQVLKDQGWQMGQGALFGLAERPVASASF
jgi:EAL domain-containing protein (putative c-di-GMP-specific phosphodiesterase class I)